MLRLHRLETDTAKPDNKALAEVYKLALVRIWKTDLADQCAWFARCESEDADTDDVSGCSG
jgi:hypothetical protein